MSVTNREVIWGGESIHVFSVLEDPSRDLLPEDMPYFTNPGFIESAIENDRKDAVISGLVQNIFLPGVSGAIPKEEAELFAKQWSAEVCSMHRKGMASGEERNPYDSILKGCRVALKGIANDRNSRSVTKIAAKRAGFELGLNLVQNRHQLGELAANSPDPRLFTDIVPLFRQVMLREPEGSTRFFQQSPRLLRNTIQAIGSLGVTAKEYKSLKQDIWLPTKTNKRHHGKTIEYANSLTGANLDPKNPADFMVATDMILKSAQAHIKEYSPLEKRNYIKRLGEMVLRTAQAPAVVK